VALCLAGAVSCGEPTNNSSPWRASHPDPAGMTFDEAGPDLGLCQITIRYPDLAPAGIEYQGNRYIQSDQSSRPASPPGQVIGHSAEWTVSKSADKLFVITASAQFSYRPVPGC
jgi:hypothetical protein